MKLRNIELIHHRRFRNSASGRTLPAFRDHLNVVFGWNGSGKSTIAGLLRSVQRGEAPPTAQFRISTDGEPISHTSDLTAFAPSFRIFDGDYIDKNLRGSARIPYIFFAGTEAVDYSKDEELLRAKRASLGSLRVPTSHDETARTTAQRISEIAGINSHRKELILGGANYSRYDKSDFEKRIKDIENRLAEGSIASVSELICADVAGHRDRLASAEHFARIDTTISGAARWMRENENSINSALAAKPTQVVSARISNLESREREWVREGVEMHFEDSDKERCLFCDSPINNKEELLKHFSSEIVRATDAIDQLLAGALRHREFLVGLSKPNAFQTHAIQELTDLIDEINVALKAKRVSISESLSPIVISKERLDLLCYPESVDLSSVAHTLERHYVAEVFESYCNQRSEYVRTVEARAALSSEIQALEQSVEEAKLKARNTHEPAAALNALFKVVFPCRTIEFRDAEDNAGYSLQRDGEPCDYSTLSEGERNFLALAHFVHSLNDDQAGFPDDGVVVIDDPASSVDQQTIFQIVSVIFAEMDKHARRQYFLLTHNLDFLGHIKALKDSPIKRNEVGLYAVRSTPAGCVLEEIPKLLRLHRSDYYYTFSVLWSMRENCELEDAYLAVNLLRRFLETFLEFKFASSGDLQSTLRSAYTKALQETEKHTTPFGGDHLQMYRFINHGSHGFADTGSIDDSLLLNAADRIKEAFRLIEILDYLHYKKLVSSVQG